MKEPRGGGRRVVGVVVVRKRSSAWVSGVRWMWKVVVEWGSGKLRVCGVVGVGVCSAIVVAMLLAEDISSI
jgi:hypothetical protein